MRAQGQNGRTTSATRPDTSTLQSDPAASKGEELGLDVACEVELVVVPVRVPPDPSVDERELLLMICENIWNAAWPTASVPCEYAGTSWPLFGLTSKIRGKRQEAIGN